MSSSYNVAPCSQVHNVAVVVVVVVVVVVMALRVTSGTWAAVL